MRIYQVGKKRHEDLPGRKETSWGSTRCERNAMRIYQVGKNHHEDLAVARKLGWFRKRSPRAQRAIFAIKNNVDLERPAKAEIQYSRE